jgi:hypothetical protein
MRGKAEMMRSAPPAMAAAPERRNNWLAFMRANLTFDAPTINRLQNAEKARARR